jgi:hypothetical protein
MIELRRYQKEFKVEWDNFVSQSRIDTFLFYRAFMEYHSDRFYDCSFMIFKKEKLIGLMPGNINGKTWYSHQGLTFGGLITSRLITTSEVLFAFNQLNIELKLLEVEEVIYKPSPHIYHLYSSEEDIYALFKLGARKIACNISSTIYQRNKIPFIESRKGGIRKSLRNNVTVIETKDFKGFWDVLEENLNRSHGKKPVHDLTEILNLSDIFSANIKLYCAFLNNEVVAGTLLFVMKNVIHVQYISANEIGKNIGALDFIFDRLINEYFIEIPIFDFGHSTEQNGEYLNENLIFQKEGFGGRGIVYDTYRYIL